MFWSGADCALVKTVIVPYRGGVRKIDILLRGLGLGNVQVDSVEFPREGGTRCNRLNVQLKLDERLLRAGLFRPENPVGRF